jgi:hypothetical protein
MIPKIIHYIWFGGKPLPKLARKCIASWEQFMPDYEIRRWDETNFDINMIPYTREAAVAKKWAFVSDYARFWILYHYGGVYFDTDVELIKPMDDILNRGAYMGIECGNPEVGISVAPGLGMAIEPQNNLIAEILKIYDKMHFDINLIGSKDMKTIVYHTTQYLYSKGLKNENKVQCVDDIYIYPNMFFCPPLLNMKITSDTHSIHHYDGSWNTPLERFKVKLYRSLILDNVIAAYIYSVLKNFVLNHNIRNDRKK